jgi:hypothetical protein
MCPWPSLSRWARNTFGYRRRRITAAIYAARRERAPRARPSRRIYLMGKEAQP